MRAKAKKTSFLSWSFIFFVFLMPLYDAHALTIEGNRQEIDLENNIVRIEGDVKARWEGNLLKAQKITYWKDKKKLKAEGKVEFSAEGLRLSSPSVTFFQEEGKLLMEKSLKLVREDMVVQGKNGWVDLKRKIGEVRDGLATFQTGTVSASRLFLEQEKLKALGNVRLQSQQDGQIFQLLTERLDYDAETVTINCQPVDFSAESLRVVSKSGTIRQKEYALFRGQVTVIQEEARITADSAHYFFKTRKLVFEGNVRLEEEEHASQG